MFEYLNDKKFIYSLKVLCDYMILNQDIEKSDVIIGCGCKYLNIPIKCAELYKDGMAKKILFAEGWERELAINLRELKQKYLRILLLNMVF